MKKLIFTFFFCAIASASAIDFGPKLSFVGPEYFDGGVGVDGFALIKIKNMIYLYPSLGFWYAHNHYDYYYHHYYYNNQYWDYYDFHVTELALNCDFAFFPPAALRVAPYLGGGVAPVITFKTWHPDYDETEVGVGLNMFGGIKFPIGRYKGLAELKGKFGSEYNVFKLSFGFLFTTIK